MATLEKRIPSFQAMPDDRKLIQDERQRLKAAVPGWTPTQSDAIRSLIAKGSTGGKIEIGETFKESGDAAA